MKRENYIDEEVTQLKEWCLLNIFNSLPFLAEQQKDKITFYLKREVESVPNEKLKLRFKEIWWRLKKWKEWLDELPGGFTSIPDVFFTHEKAFRSTKAWWAKHHQAVEKRSTNDVMYRQVRKATKILKNTDVPIPVYHLDKKIWRNKMTALSPLEIATGIEVIEREIIAFGKKQGAPYLVDTYKIELTKSLKKYGL